MRHILAGAENLAHDCVSTSAPFVVAVTFFSHHFSSCEPVNKVYIRSMNLGRQWVIQVNAEPSHRLGLRCGPGRIRGRFSFRDHDSVTPHTLRNTYDSRAGRNGLCPSIYTFQPSLALRRHGIQAAKPHVCVRLLWADIHSGSSGRL